MRISEITINPNKKVLEQLYSDKIHAAYELYELFQNITSDFSKSSSELYEDSFAIKMIHELVRLIELLQEDNVPDSTQIIIALNELLDYFNK